VRGTIKLVKYLSTGVWYSFNTKRIKKGVVNEWLGNCSSCCCSLLVVK